VHSGSESRNLSAIGAMEGAYSRPISGMTQFLKMQVKSFRLVLRSIDAASVQIMSNATLTLMVVCDLSVWSHLST